MSKTHQPYFVLNIVISFVLFFTLSASPHQVQAAGVCGAGSWTSGSLEVHHINIGQGDSTLIVGPTGTSLLFDAGETAWNSSAKAQIIGPYIQSVLGCKALDYVVISHFHLDHVGYVGYGGLWHLVEVQGFTVGKTLVRDYVNYLGDISGTFTNWKTYLEGMGQTKLHPTVAVEGMSQVNLGAGVTFNVVVQDGNGALPAGDFRTNASPPSENDYSIGALLSYGNFDEWIGGDLSGQYAVGGFGYTYHDIELSAAPEVGDVDVYRVNHHGSSHSTSPTFINQLDPEVSIVSVGNSNTYGHPAQLVMNQLLATSTVYMTQRGDPATNIGSAIVAGDIVIKTANGLSYTVNGTAFTATEPARTDMDGDGYFAGVDPNDSSSSVIPSPNGGYGPVYQSGSASCQVSPGQVLINEVFPIPLNNGIEWVELYNTTASTINLGYCYIDDISGGSPPYQIPASTLIPPYGFWTLDRIGYFNNTGGDQVRFLKEDGNTILDSYSYGSLGTYDIALYRLPDGGSWAGSSTVMATKGQSNTVPFYPIVSSVARVDENPTTADSVHFTIKFSKPVGGVNTSAPFSDFALTTTGITGASISAVAGSGDIYTITVNTGTGSGTIRLDVIDDDSIRDTGNHPLGGAGAGNGSFIGSEPYTVTHQAIISGNAGVAGATLNYTGGSTTADVNGNYSFVVPSGWSGTVTPSRPNYSFSPASRTYTNVTSHQVAQNYTATYLLVSISGNTGVGSVTLSYISGTPKTVISQADGSYSFQVSRGWSGTVTPSKSGYIFSPGSRTYSNVLSNQTAQNYTALALYSISGNAGAAGVTLSYVNGTTKTVTSQADGSYSFIVPSGWSGTVTPSKSGYRFSPANRTYASVAANQAAQNYTAVPLYAISGNAGVAGVTLSYTDGTLKTVTSQLNGDYSLTVPSIWTGAVTPSHACYTFNPITREYNGLAGNQTSQDYMPGIVSGCADVDVSIGGTEQGRFGIPAQGSTRASFVGVNNGPVQIVSTNGLPLMGAERLIYKVNGVNTSFTELMALPNKQLDTSYWLPWYNNKDLDTQLRFANVSDQTATVHIYIGGVEMPGSPFTLQAGESTRQSFAGVNDGPVQIVSDQNIVAAERVVFKVNGTNTSYTEMMALPNSQLDTSYWLPWYNNVELDTQLRFANVSEQTATVHIYIGGMEMPGSPFTLQAGESTRQSFPAINDGPVQIVSDQNLVAAERVIYKVNGVNTSFTEMMALPNNQLDKMYWLPWYNNKDIDTQLRFANVSDQTATVHVYIGGVEMPGSPFTLQAGESTRQSFAGVSSGPVQIMSDQNLVAAERLVYKVNNIPTSFSEMMALPNSQLDTTYWLPWYNNATADLDTQLRFGTP